jgi:hypothetical protein
MNFEDYERFEELNAEIDAIVADMNESNSASDRKDLYEKYTERMSEVKALMRKYGSPI